MKTKDYANTLLCTVGTSLFMPNLAKLDPETLYQSDPAPSDPNGITEKRLLEHAGLWDDRGRLKAVLANVKRFYLEKEWSLLAKELLHLPPALRLLGAEINSIAAMISKCFLLEDRIRLVFMVSDTEDGANIGAILKHYFSNRDCVIGFRECTCLPVKGLQDEKPTVFQVEGLSNLVRIMGEQLRKWGSESIAINATGGYKAQIALAVAFGQVTHTPVYYKHERFDQVIRFPRMPFAIDLSLVDAHLPLWANLAEPGACLTAKEMDAMLPGDEEGREQICPMMDSIDDGNKTYFAISALGLVYWEAYLTRNPGVKIIPAKAGKRNGCNFRDDHYPIGFREHVNKVYNTAVDFINECHSLPYDHQKSIKQIRFYEKTSKIIGEYVDKNQFGARFEILTEAHNSLERLWIIDYLNSNKYLDN